MPQKQEPLANVKHQEQAKPVAQPNPARPAQLAALEKQKQAEARALAQKEQQATAAPQKEQKKDRAQKQQFKTITPAADRKDVKGGVNISGNYTPEAAPKTRVVDTRISDVNLSKYDDRYNEQFYAIANGTDTKASKQKLKKQDSHRSSATYNKPNRAA